MSYSINMGTRKGPLFRLVSPHELIQRRDFSVKNDPAHTHTVVDPRDSYPLLGGEWVALDTTDPETIIRPPINNAHFDPAGDEAVDLSDVAIVRTFMCLHELGGGDTQTLRKVPLAFLQGYEVETRLYLTTGNPTFAIGDKVYVGQVQHPDVTSEYLVAGLVPAGAGGQLAEGAVAVGHITKLPDNNGGWLRIMVDDRL